MTEEELKKIITQLKSRNEKNKAHFGFYQYGGGPDESYIKANKQGLELFAVELLRAGIESKNREFANNKVETIGLDLDWIHQDGDFLIDYIEITNKDRDSTNKAFPTNKESWKEKILKVGCIVIGIVVIGLIVIGFISVLSWIL